MLEEIGKGKGIIDQKLNEKELEAIKGGKPWEGCGKIDCSMCGTGAGNENAIFSNYLSTFFS